LHNAVYNWDISRERLVTAHTQKEIEMRLSTIIESENMIDDIEHAAVPEDTVVRGLEIGAVDIDKPLELLD
jgi:hypothetical protein